MRVRAGLAKLAKLLVSARVAGGALLVSLPTDFL